MEGEKKKKERESVRKKKETFVITIAESDLKALHLAPSSLNPPLPKIPYNISLVPLSLDTKSLYLKTYPCS